MKVVRGIVLQPTSSNNRTAVSQHRPLLVSSTDVCNLWHLGCLLSRSTSGLALSEWFCCKFGLCATYAAIQVLPSQICLLQEIVLSFLMSEHILQLILCLLRILRVGFLLMSIMFFLEIHQMETCTFLLLLNFISHVNYFGCSSFS